MPLFCSRENQHPSDQNGTSHQKQSRYLSLLFKWRNKDPLLDRRNNSLLFESNRFRQMEGKTKFLRKFHECDNGAEPSCAKETIVQDPQNRT